MFSERQIDIASALASIAIHAGLFALSWVVIRDIPQSQYAGNGGGARYKVPVQFQIRSVQAVTAPAVEPLVPQQEITPVKSKLPFPESPVTKANTLHQVAQPFANKAPSTLSTQKGVSGNTTAPFPGDREGPGVGGSIRPVYPKRAISQGWAGTVEVEFTIDATGTVIGSRLIRSSGYTVLDDSFINTVKTQYHFEPRRVQGQNLEGRIKLSHTFSIN